MFGLQEKCITVRPNDFAKKLTFFTKCIEMKKKSQMIKFAKVFFISRK